MIFKFEYFFDTFQIFRRVWINTDLISCENPTLAGDLFPAEARFGLHGLLLLFLRLPRIHHHRILADVRGQVGARVEQHRSGRAHGVLPGPAPRDAYCRHISGERLSLLNKSLIGWEIF